MEKTLPEKREHVKQFNVSLPPSLVAGLDEIARLRLTNRSTLLRQAAAQLVRESLLHREVQQDEQQ